VKRFEGEEALGQTLERARALCPQKCQEVGRVGEGGGTGITWMGSFVTTGSSRP